MSEVLHLILRMMAEQWKTMDEELIVYRLNQTAEMAEQIERERDEAREKLQLVAQRARVQAGAYKLEDLRDNSRWSIFNEGRAQALEAFAEGLEATK